MINCHGMSAGENAEYVPGSRTLGCKFHIMALSAGLLLYDLCLNLWLMFITHGPEDDEMIFALIGTQGTD